MKGLGALLVESNMGVSVLPKRMDVLHVDIRYNKMIDFLNLKSRGKDVNQACLDPNAPKKNTSYGMGARKDN